MMRGGEELFQAVGAGVGEHFLGVALLFDPALVQNLGSMVAGGHDGANVLLDLPDPPTAIFCYNDRMALAAVEAVRERGLSVPEDVSVVGFDDDPFVIQLLPNLTTANLPHEEMAAHRPQPNRRWFAVRRGLRGRGRGGCRQRRCRANP